MKRFIYYPGFEIEDENWLKFALLYLEKLNPIVPMAAENHLSATFKKVQNSTDLLEIHKPLTTEGGAATRDAIDQIKKMKAYPSSYENIIDIPTFLNDSRKRENWQSEIYHDKYTHDFKEFCIDEGFGEPSYHGLRVSDLMGALYMSFLAQSIADSNDISPITDNPILDKLSIAIHRARRRSKSSFSAAQSIISLQLPVNISEIALDEIIQFRENSGIKEKFRAFHATLDEYCSAVESGINAEEYNKTLSSTIADYAVQIVSFGFGIPSVTLAIWNVAHGASMIDTQNASTALSGIGSIIGSSIALRNQWKINHDKILTRRYLGNLRKFGK